MKFTSMLRQLVQMTGYDVRRVHKFDNDMKVLAHILAARGIDCVIDIGANEGQFASSLYKAGYAGALWSFEPLVSAREALMHAAAKHAEWKIAPPFALGREHSEAVLHIAGNSISSSLLPMENLHVKAAPKSIVVGQHSVAVERLDQVLTEHLHLRNGHLFVKLDTQGTELDILEGASGIFSRVVGLKIELSFAPLYTGQPLFDDVYHYIRGLGFELWDLVPGFRYAASGRLLQCDGIFFRSDT